MKKLLSVLVLALCLALGGLVACSKPAEEGKDDPVVPTTYTVAFEVDGTRYATEKVKAGETIAQGKIVDPTKTGYDFDYWTLNGVETDIYAYVVNGNVTFVAHFTEKTPDPVDETLNVNDVKDAEKTYYLVIGWWETTDTNEDGSQKHTSYLDETEVRRFYANVILYLQAKGATQDEIDAISVRNYSTVGVEEMGTNVNTDGDVDIMIGVGNNINSKAGVSLYEGNDGKFSTEMGTTPTSRYVALLANTRNIGINVFDWLKTETGKQAFKRALDASEITVVPERSTEINLTVTVHGDTDEVTVLTDDTTAITLPEITIGEDKIFKGWAKSEGGEVVLSKATDITYNDVKSLVNVGDTELELYPILEAKPTVNPGFSVYIQVQGNNLTEDEAILLKTRFLATLSAEEAARVIFHIEVVSKADKFTEIIDDAEDIDVVIGGNSPLKDYPANASGKLANAGTGHFANTSRKIIIHAKANDLDLAAKLYAFVTSDYVAGEVAE